MRFLIYTENYLFGGGVKYLIDFINELPDGIEVVLSSNDGGISPNEYKEIKKSIYIHPIKIRSLNLLIKNYYFPFNILLKAAVKFKLGFIAFFLKILSKYNKSIFTDLLISKKIDFVLVFNGGFPGGLTSFDLIGAAKELQINTGMSVVSFPAKKSLFDNYYESAIHSIKCFLVNCSGIKQELNKSRFIPLNKIHVLQNKFDVSKFDFSCEERRISTNIRFGFIGRIHKDKGINDLIKSFNKVLSIDSDLSLTIFGHGKIVDGDCRRIVERSNCIKVAGPFNNINSVLKEIDVLILPSHAEGLPFVVVEALGYGIPVIATRVGCMDELIKNEFNGLLVNVSNEDELIHAILYFKRNRNKIVEMGRNGRSYIVNNYNLSQYKKKHEEIVRSFFS